MIRKILIYENSVTDQHPALQRAMQIAQTVQVQLKVVNVLDGPSDSLRELHRPMRSLVEQARKDQLDAMCSPLRVRGIEFKTELISGRPFIEIVREVVHEGFHLVVKAVNSDAVDPTGAPGPVDMRLVRNCPCPVWLEFPGREVACNRVLVAVDPQSGDDALNTTLLEMGGSLADAADADLHVVAAWEVLDAEFLAQKMRPEGLARYTQDIRTQVEESLAAMLRQAGRQVKPMNRHFHNGNPTEVILSCVSNEQPDVLVIGTVGTTNVSGLLIGDTTDSVLRRVQCSVLAVKPNNLFRA